MKPTSAIISSSFVGAKDFVTPRDEDIKGSGEAECGKKWTLDPDRLQCKTPVHGDYSGAGSTS